MLRKVVFLLPVFMVATLDLGARAPVLKDPPAAPKPGTGSADGLILEAKVEGKPGHAAVLCFNAKNPTDDALETDVEVALMEAPPSSPMARMVPMPRERARRIVHVALGPGESMEKRFTIAKVKMPRAKKKARRKGKRKGPRLTALMGRTRATLFAEVRKQGEESQGIGGLGLIKRRNPRFKRKIALR